MAVTATGALQSVRHGVSRYYPFTVVGTLVFGIGVVFVARGTLVGDVYRMTLGVLAVAAPVVLGVLARVQSGRFTDIDVSWDTSRDTVATMTDPRRWGHMNVGVSGISPWFFYRLHARVSGTVAVGTRARLHFYEDIAVAESRTLRVPLAIPLPGTARLTGRLQVGDVFGLSRANLGDPTRLSTPVPPGMPRAPQLIQSVATSGEEESTRTRSPEEERYYMREYIPGDRFRDINWKASSRIRELFTRISPETQEQSRTITIYLRHFADSSRPTLEAIAHGAYIRGWVIAFMRTLMSQEPGISFRVVTARGTTPCVDEDAVDTFAWSIADLGLEPEPPMLEIDRAAAHAVVFTTPLDRTLDAFAARLPKASVTLFSTQFAGGRTPTQRGGAQMHTTDTATIICGGHLLPIPPLGLAHRGDRPTQSAPPGALFLEEVALTLVFDRTTHERGRNGGTPR